MERKPSGAGWGGDRAGRTWFILLASGHLPRELRPGHPTMHGGSFSPNSTLLGNLGESLSISQHPCATLRPQPTHSGRYSTNGCHSLTWERRVFSKPLVNQSEAGLLPILNLYGGFLLELACTQTH